MRELRDVVAAFEALPRGARAVLGTVVHAEGSTYRRPGARMLVLPDESTVGLVSGGCLEGDLALRAREVARTGEAVSVRYDATADEDIVWGLGLGCAGIVDVLLERVTREAPGPLPALRACLAGEASVLATVVASEGAGAPPLASHPPVAPEDAARVLGAGRAERVVRREGAARAEVLLEPLLPPVALLLLGAGPDAEPVARLADALGWEVRVWDARSAWARPERFPGARSVTCCPVEEVAARVEVGPETVALVMTHHYLRDRELLAWLLPSPARYVGVLGPRRRTEDLLRDLREDGRAPTDEQQERLYAPAGLDVGAEGAAEIALALLGEVQAVCAGRAGGPLRERKGPIHDPVA